MAKVTFYLNYNKSDKKGFVPIFAQFTNKGQKFRKYTGEKVLSPNNDRQKFWNANTQRVTSKHPNWATINDVLDALSDQITTSYREEKIKGKIPTANKVKSIVEVSTGENTVKNDFFFLFQTYIDSAAGIKSNGTIKNYNNSLNYIKKFRDDKSYHIDFDSVDSNFYEKFNSYLVNTVSLTNNTIGRVFKNIKSFLNWATDKNYNINLAYKKFKAIKEEKEIIYLTSEELNKLYNLKFKAPNPLFEEIRDVFCLGCYTGLRISDLKTITKDNVKNDEIHIRVQKTKDIIRIPLLPQAKTILKRYNYELPKYLDQKINLHIKTICKEAKIKDSVFDIKYKGAEIIKTAHKKHELITTHVARKTFVTLCLEKGVRPEVVMSITGHSDYKTMKPYIKVADKVKKESLLSAWK